MSEIIDTFANRLTKAVSYRNIKPIELSEKTGIDKSKISSYMSGRYKAKQDGIHLLSKILNVDPAWLMGYDVPIEPQFRIDELGNPVKEVPILGVVKAGYNYLAQENWIGTIDINKKLAETGEFFALKIHGDSMSPVFIEGDTVVVKKQDDFESGDIVVALINGDEATVKKGKKSENSILLQPLNTNYEPLIFTSEEMKTIPVKIIGIVKKLDREF